MGRNEPGSHDSARQGIWGCKVFRSATYSVGFADQNALALIIVPPLGRHVIFGIHCKGKCLDQPSKLHNPPLNSLACCMT